jgi:hypothetical protein
MRKFKILLIFFFFTSIIYSQTYYRIDWEKTYGGTSGEMISEIKQTKDGCYILGGITNSNNGDVKSINNGSNDIWLVKTDSIGNILWEKTYGGTSYELLTSFQTTSDGGYILVGYTNSTDGDVKSGKKGDWDCWAIKTDSVGNIVWEKTYGGTKTDIFFDVQQISNGRYVFGGSTKSSDGDVISGKNRWEDFWVVCTDSIGNILWEKTYGGTSNERINSIQTTSDGGYILGGNSYSVDGDVQSGNKGGEDCWVVKIDSLGVILWEKSYGGSGGENISKIRKTSDSGYIFGGYTTSINGDIKSGNKGSGDVWVVKINSTGNILWEKTYGGSKGDDLEDIQVTPEGGYIFGGQSFSSNGDVISGNKGSSDCWMVYIDSIGKIVWENTYGGSDQESIKSVQLTSNGLFVMGGYTYSINGDVNSGNKGGEDSWLIKLEVNVKPTDLILSINKIIENSPVNSIIGRFNTIDKDIEDTFIYKLKSDVGVTDNNYFVIKGDSLILIKDINYESKSLFSIIVSTTDISGNEFYKTISIIVLNENDKPKDILLTNNRINENSIEDSEIGPLLTVDEDSLDTFTYSLDSILKYPDNKYFLIKDGILKSNTTFDFESKSLYIINIMSLDSGGLKINKSFFVSVNDINEPPLNISINSLSIDEGKEIGTVIGTINTTDADTNESFTYSFDSSEGGEDNSKFVIQNGILKSNSIFDYETKIQYNIRIQSTDKSGNSISKSFVISINNKNENPTSLQLTLSQPLYENSTKDKLVGVLTSSIDFPMTSFTYSLIINEFDNNNFYIIGSNLFVKENLNFEIKSTYTLSIKTTTNQDFSLTKQFVVNIVDVSEKPTDIKLGLNQLNYVVNKGREVGVLSTTDDDTNDTHSYSLVSGDGSIDNGLFMIIGDKLYTTSVLDISTNTYFFRIQTLDSQGLTLSKYFTLSDINVGIESISSNQIQVYPVPTSDVLTIKSEKTILPFDIELYNLNGQLILKKMVIDEVTEIFMGNLIDGTYLLRFSRMGIDFKQDRIFKK